MNTRITTGMVQRNILSALNQVDGKLTRTQARAASGKQITRPSDDPYNTSRAMGLRQALAANQQYQTNVSDARGWQDATESALQGITRFTQRARDLVIQAGSDATDQTSRNSIASEIDQIIQGVKETANASYGDVYLFSGTKTDTAPYAMGADDTYKGDDAGLDPAVPGVLREIGPGVTMSINTVGREVLGDGQPAAGGTADNGLLNTLRDIADHLRSGDADSLRGTDLDRIQANLNNVLAVRARNGAASNRLDAADTRLQQIEQATTEQLSDVEDADFAQTMIDLNSQSAAYQAALRSGATIVQSSLMDFLR
jgi:flagellar hook-associated protein 3 FlgL